MLALAVPNLRTVAACAGLLLWGCDEPPGQAPRGAAGAQPVDAPATAAVSQPLDPQLLGQRLGVAVTALEGGAVRAVLPRADLAVEVNGAPAPKALALGTSVEFRPAAEGAALSGNASLLEDEISPALDTLLAHGIQVVGLHNRFAFDEPRVLSLHFTAEGNAALLASGVQSLGAAIRDARLRSPSPLPGSPGEAPTPGSLDAKAIGGALGLDAQLQGQDVLVTSPWPAAAKVPPAVAGEPALRAVWTGSDVHAAVAGSFVLTLPELAPVIGGLRRGNLHVSAVYPYATAQQPSHFLVHFLGKGTSLDLVRAVKLGLDARQAPR